MRMEPITIVPCSLDESLFGGGGGVGSGVGVGFSVDVLSLDCDVEATAAGAFTDMLLAENWFELRIGSIVMRARFRELDTSFTSAVDSCVE